MPVRSLLQKIDKRLIERNSEKDSQAAIFTWSPRSGTPQERAFYSPADELFFGGIAGAGKSDLLLGLALTAHRDSIIFRREYPQLKGLIKRSKEIVGSSKYYNSTDKVWAVPDSPIVRTLEFGAVQYEDDREKFQGRPHDLIGFDECTHFSLFMVQFLIGWNRTVVENQRCRVVFTGNPPQSVEGRWVIDYFAPWLDPKYPKPAKPGELRYFIMDNANSVEVPTPDPVEIKKGGHTITIKPRSRTFIPGKMIPDLEKTGYAATLQGLPEPLRSQLLYGDFSIQIDDDIWQVIPTTWVQAAMKRWYPRKTSRQTAIGVDVARGGQDKTILACRYDDWVEPLIRYPGSATPDGDTVAGQILKHLLAKSYVAIDVIGVGSSPYDYLKRMPNVKVYPLDARQKSTKLNKEKTMGFVNKRAEWYWNLRELLDPNGDRPISLPDDSELLADLCSARWTPQDRTDENGDRRTFVKVESKEDIIKRLGRSPDAGDAVVYAFAEVKDSLDEWWNLI